MGKEFSKDQKKKKGNGSGQKKTADGGGYLPERRVGGAFGSLVTLAGLLAGFMLPVFASAAVVTSSATVNGGAAATVISGASVTIAATVGMSAASNEWHGTSYAIASALPDTLLCADTDDDSGIGTTTESFAAAAPTVPGTYNLYVQAKSTNTCGGSTVGTLLVVPNAVTVSSSSGGAGTGSGSGSGSGGTTSTPVTLHVTGIDEIRTTATADNTFDHGFRWIFHVTVPDAETALGMKFSDFVSGAKIIPAAGDFRFYSAQSDDASSAGSAIVDPLADTYAGEMNLAGDLSPSLPGRQIDIAVEAKVPPGTKAGNYSGMYGARTLLPVIEAHFVQP